MQCVSNVYTLLANSSCSLVVKFKLFVRNSIDQYTRRLCLFKRQLLLTMHLEVLVEQLASKANVSCSKHVINMQHEARVLRISCNFQENKDLPA